MQRQITATEEQVFKLCQRLIDDEITPNQCHYWLSIWGIDAEEAIDIFKKELQRRTWAELRWCTGFMMICLSIYIIFSRLL